MNFNTSIKTGETWNGRIAFKAEEFCQERRPMDYSIEIPVDMPQAIISGKNADIGILTRIAEIRSQVFFQKELK